MGRKLFFFMAGKLSRAEEGRKLAGIHAYVYTRSMKRRDLEKKLRDLGWRFHRHGGKHDVWTNADDTRSEYVPRHTEINERLARAILKNAEES